GVTPVVIDAKLLDGFESMSVPVIWTASRNDSELEGFTVATMVRVTLDADASDAKLSVTSPPAYVGDPPTLSDAETKLALAGSVSVSATPGAGDGPLFVPTIVNVTF